MIHNRFEALSTILRDSNPEEEPETVATPPLLLFPLFLFKLTILSAETFARWYALRVFRPSALKCSNHQLKDALHCLFGVNVSKLLTKCLL